MNYRISTMDWIVKKGSTVEEDNPIRFSYVQTRMIECGRPEKISVLVYVYSDVENDGAPLYLGCE